MAQTYPIDEVLKHLKINALQVKAGFLALQQPVPDELDPQAALSFVILDLLERLHFLKPEQRTAILVSISEMVNANRPVAHIYFADSRYCAWSGKFMWLDLETGEEIPECPYEPIETIAYNLRGLERQLLAKLEGTDDQSK